MRFPLVTLAIVLFAGCDKPRAPEEKDAAPPPAAAPSSPANQAVRDTAPAATDTSAPALDSAVFAVADSVVEQTVAVRWRKEDEIDYRFVVRNKQSGKTREMAGRAAANLDVDPEMDEDEEGTAYSANEFVHEAGDCWFSVRIDMDSTPPERVRTIASSECGAEPDLPLVSVGVMRRRAAAPR
ncbi:MAG TPA: hypothetical protein VF092_02255 [Longimicrobium sp.]